MQAVAVSDGHTTSWKHKYMDIWY